MICGIWWILHGFMETWLGNERMKKGQISRHRKRKLGVRWAMDILMEPYPSHSHLETQQFYYAQEDRLACLSRRSFQGTRLQVYIWEQGLLPLLSICSANLRTWITGRLFLFPESDLGFPNAWGTELLVTNTHMLRTSSAPHTFYQGYLRSSQIDRGIY